RGKIADLEKVLNAPTPELEAAQARWERDAAKGKLPPNIVKLLVIEAAKRNDGQKAELAKYYRSIAPETKKTRDEIAAAQKQLTAVKGVATPIMRELPENQRRKTHIMIRGNSLEKGREVTSGVPAVLPPIESRPAAGLQSPNRLDLARWLTDPQNPLTARVTVNRYWEQIFGVGLVDTP